MTDRRGWSSPWYWSWSWLRLAGGALVLPLDGRGHRLVAQVREDRAPAPAVVVAEHYHSPQSGWVEAGVVAVPPKAALALARWLEEAARGGGR